MKNNLQVSQGMIEAGFKVLSNSGITDEFVKADKLLVAEIFQSMMGQFLSERQTERKQISEQDDKRNHTSE